LSRETISAHLAEAADRCERAAMSARRVVRHLSGAARRRPGIATEPCTAALRRRALNAGHAAQTGKAEPF